MASKYKEQEKQFMMLRLSIADLVSTSSDETAGKLLKAAFKYELTREEPEFDDVLARGIFSMIKPDFEFCARQYEQQCENNKARRQAGIAKAEIKSKILEITERYYLTDIAAGINENPEELEKELNDLDKKTLTQLEDLLARLMDFEEFEE